MKLKNKVIGTIFGVVTSSLVFIAVPVSAQAGECSAADPCHTYAMVNDAGVVTNIIVCQPSVCGSGYLDGSKVVLQVVANPVNNQNQGGIFGGVDNKDKIVTESNNVFTVKENDKVIETFAAPEINKNESVTITTSMLSNSEIKTVTLTDNSKTTIEVKTVNATQTVVSENTSITSNENLALIGKKTEEQVVQIVNSGNYPIFKSKIAMLTRLLESWVL